MPEWGQPSAKGGKVKATLEERLAHARMLRRLPDPASRRVLRLRARVSQQAIAEEVGCSREEIARWELGTRSPGPRFLPAYLRVLDRLARELMSDG